MNSNKCKQLLKEEWEFHKCNPEMLFVWATYLTSIIHTLTQ